jgi:hypothetical protein
MKKEHLIIDAIDAVATSRAFATALLMMANDLPDDDANAFQAVMRGMIESLQQAGDALDAVHSKEGCN